MKPVRVLRRALGAVALVGLAGCATVAPSSPATAAVADPWENWNRKVFDFNEALDRAVLKPVAETYRDVVPRLARTGVDNVLGNVYDVWSTANQFLQGKVQTGLEMGMRVLTNTLFGLGGLLDPATEMGLTRRSDDFGQTLGRWGLGNGPYLVLPLFGPSTLRDTAGLVVDRQASPSTLADTTAASYGVSALELVNARTNLLATGQLVDRVALDKYVFVRDAYLARRRDALYDGAPPMEAFIDEGADPPAPPAPPASASAPAPAPAK
ncbi:MAG: VacJ family lipoprotein [Rubrivivax sp.]|nr:VacJ family lipoprotein [Rubrivivax sp.]